ncbi:hypothetical protein [Brucella pituitosa]|uniref:hypothetical protein n=1 Tax=Brucella pituitosa TaxID=571256 RepID=UPI0009A23157|nr:hypothetical protein [Brucella pituitosa]
MNGKSDRRDETAGQAPRLFRYILRLTLMLCAVLIVVFLAWTFLGGAKVSSTRFIQSKPGAPSSSQSVKVAPTDDGRQ